MNADITRRHAAGCGTVVSCKPDGSLSLSLSPPVLVDNLINIMKHDHLELITNADELSSSQPVRTHQMLRSQMRPRNRDEIYMQLTTHLNNILVNIQNVGTVLTTKSARMHYTTAVSYTHLTLPTKRIV